MVLRCCKNLNIREGNHSMNIIIRELLLVFVILVVQMLFFMYFIKQGWTLKELVTGDAFRMYWIIHVVCRIFVNIVIIKYGKNKKDQ